MRGNPLTPALTNALECLVQIRSAAYTPFADDTLDLIITQCGEALNLPPGPDYAAMLCEVLEAVALATRPFTCVPDAVAVGFAKRYLIEVIPVLGPVADQGLLTAELRSALNTPPLSYVMVVDGVPTDEPRDVWTIPSPGDTLEYRDVRVAVAHVHHAGPSQAVVYTTRTARQPAPAASSAEAF